MKKLTSYGDAPFRHASKLFTKISITTLLLLFITPRLLEQICEPNTLVARTFSRSDVYVSVPNRLSATFTVEAGLNTTNGRSCIDAWRGGGRIWPDDHVNANYFIPALLNNKLLFLDGNANAQTDGQKTGANLLVKSNAGLKENAPTFNINYSVSKPVSSNAGSMVEYSSTMIDNNTNTSISKI